MEKRKRDNPVFEVGYVEVPELPAWLIPLVMVAVIIGISVVIVAIIRKVRG